MGERDRFKDDRIVSVANLVETREAAMREASLEGSG
jgi:hypothetical protein